ncbi:MAG: carbonic anhydrase [Pseudomonadota bacterium]
MTSTESKATSASPASPSTSPSAPFPERLLKGYANFIAERFPAESARYKSLAATGQKPRTIVIACCDSRAAPETIFNAGPGELFVVRNVANLVPPYEPDGGNHSTSAALEFAVQSLKVESILVLGHGRCGGIGAALNPGGEPLSPGDFIGKWMSPLTQAATTVAANGDLTKQEQQTALERLSIRNSIANLRTFPNIKSLEEEGKISLHGAWFDISSGELWVLNSDTEEFTLAPSGVVSEL